ncbi:MAG TPA: hypothetical protein VED41_01100 [Solirubrobacteraceae bacterium]|nr:hypothetical protein [Solirubrobacteraceae bacterium]
MGLLACASLLATASAHAAAVTPLPEESMQAYEQQLASGQVSAAELNLDARSIHLTLSDGKHWLIHYGSGQEAGIVKALRAKGIIPVTPKGKPIAEAKPHKHKIRYIVGGVLIVVIIIVVAVLLIRRRRTATADY